MGVSNGIVTTPVNPQEVYVLLGVGKYNGYYDIGYLCSNNHGKINKCAKYKPVRYNSVAELNVNNIAYVNYGLDVQHAVSGVVMANKTLRDFPWNYLAPRGGDYNEPFRLTDFINYSHYAVPPILFTFPSRLIIKGGNTGIIVEGINAAFNDLGQDDWDQTYCLRLQDVIPDSALDYRFTVGLLITNPNTGAISTWYVTDSKTLRERFTQRDYGTVDVSLKLKDAGINTGFQVQMIYFLSANNLPNGAYSLVSADSTSLEYNTHADRRVYTVEYVSPTEGLTATIDFTLNSYTGTYFYVNYLHVKVTKSSTWAPTDFFMTVQAELASVKYIDLVKNLRPSFIGNVYEQTWTTNQLPEENAFQMSNPDRDEFSCALRFDDTINGYNEIMASKSVDVNN